MKSKLLQKLNCQYVDEIFTIVGIVFIVGMLFRIGSLNQQVHEVSAEQVAQIQKMANVAEKRLSTIHKLESTVNVMQTTLAEQNKALHMLTENHEKQSFILQNCIKYKEK